MASGCGGLAVDAHGFPAAVLTELQEEAFLGVEGIPLDLGR